MTSPDLKSKVLDIAMNLTRIGNWAADGYASRRKRILIFLDQTSHYLKSINQQIDHPIFKQTFSRFCDEFRKLEIEGKKGPKDELVWAEKMLTWGNILTHRAQLLEK